MSNITLPRAYAGVTGMITLISMQYLGNRNLELMMRKDKLFDEDQMHLTHGEDHMTQIGDHVASMGYPDDGNGRYMDKKSYRDWYFLNIQKRVHTNDFEHIASVLPLSLANGLVHPWTTTGLLLTYFCGRMFFTAGYHEKEGAYHPYRIAGSIGVNTAHLFTIIMSFSIAVRMIRGQVCLQKTLSILPK